MWGTFARRAISIVHHNPIIFKRLSSSLSKTVPMEAPYGSWKSPITSELLNKGSVMFELCGIDTISRRVFWTESRASEKGRDTLISDFVDNEKRNEKSRIEHTPGIDEYNVRSQVHEYGGQQCRVYSGKNQSKAVFSNAVDSRIYKMIDGKISPLTKDSGKVFRYADMTFHPSGDYLVAIREDHTIDTPAEVVNTLVAIDFNTGEEKVLASGSDFYSTPTFNPKANEIAFVSWEHPNMPWDHTSLHVAKLDSSKGLPSLIDDKVVAGGDKVNESAITPLYASDGTLYFACDRTGFWNLYRLIDGEPGLLLDKPVSGEFAEAQWRFGMRNYVPLASDPSKVFASFIKDGVQKFGLIDVKEKNLKEIDIPLTAAGTKYESILDSNGDDLIIFEGASYSLFLSLLTYNIKTGKLDVVLSSSNPSISNGYFPKAEAITFQTSNGKEAYGYYYPPTNSDFVAPKGTLPPLRVIIHGGPTARTQSMISLRIAYWTSRGFSIMDVNYGGSTGYGREFRQRLNKQWGIVDVDDACNAAEYLVKAGKVDSKKLVISGGSAGGYTVLACIAFKDTFAAGASHYGVADMSLLAAESHKFESQYVASLVGNYPEEKKLFDERSPIYSVDNITVPCIFFQGDQDKVVPPSQAEVMVEALKKKGLPVSYTLFNGEGHGFRRAENKQRALDGEFDFFGQMLGFEPANKLEPPLEIFNWVQDKKINSL